MAFPATARGAAPPARLPTPPRRTGACASAPPPMTTRPDRVPRSRARVPRSRQDRHTDPRRRFHPSPERVARRENITRSEQCSALHSQRKPRRVALGGPCASLGGGPVLQRRQHLVHDLLQDDLPPLVGRAAAGPV